MYIIPRMFVLFSVIFGNNMLCSFSKNYTLMRRTITSPHLSVVV